MLYTVIPLERIYADFNKNEEASKNEKNQQKQDTSMDYKDVQLRHGRLVTRRDGENYVVERVNSTDMSDYLNDEYCPGKVIKNKQ
jgi:hypothetical protein